jgi:hypothetical protein
MADPKNPTKDMFGDWSGVNKWFNDAGRNIGNFANEFAKNYSMLANPYVPRATTPTATSATQAGRPATGGQRGAWSTNYGTTAAAERARLTDAQSNVTPTPNNMPMTRPGTPAAAPKPFTADMLYQDAAPVYQPLMDLYGTQQQAARERYGVNQADIKNIFGNLTTIRGADKTKIAQQYQTSIEQQQQALAARTAETRQGVAAGQQGAAMAAGEMGTAGQPAPTTSLTAQAAEQGIADANAYQTTWSALQNVMSQQAQNDVQSAVQGYDYQQASALEQLRANLEDRLMGIEENMAGTESQIAQANFGSRQNVLNVKYGEEQARQAAIAKAQAAAQSAAAKKPSYANNLFGLQQRAADAGIDYSQIQSTVNDAYASAFAALNPSGVYDEKENPTGTKSPKTPKKADILNAWNYIKSGSPQTAARLSPFVTEYVDQQY